MKQQVVMGALMHPEFERGHGNRQWHGGPITANNGTVGDYAPIMLLRRPSPTVNFRVDYLSTSMPAIGRATYAIAP